MASADDNSTQLPADPAFLTPPAHVVTRGSFRCIPCRKGPGSLVYRYVLVKFGKEGRAPQCPHPIYHPLKPGKISAWNDVGEEESGKYCFRPNMICYIVAKYYSRLNIICYIVADCDVQVHLMRRRTHGMLLQSTLQIKEVDTVEIVVDLWQEAEDFMHQTGTHMTV
jgi:hypothetical protein